MASSIRAFATRHPAAAAGIVLLALLVAAAVFAPLLTSIDPSAVAPIKRLRPPGEAGEAALLLDAAGRVAAVVEMAAGTGGWRLVRLIADA